MHKRLLFHIHKSALPHIIGILGKSSRIHLAKVGILRMIRGRLPNVIKACPKKLPHGKRRIPVYGNTVLHRSGSPAGNTVSQCRALFIILCQDPCMQGKMVYSSALHDRRGLTSVDHPVRVFPVMLLIVFFRIIISGDLQNICAFLGIFPGHIIGAYGRAGILAGIIFFYQLLKLPGQLQSPFPCMGIIDLISNTKQDHTGMVPVPLHPAFHIPFMPVLK